MADILHGISRSASLVPLMIAHHTIRRHQNALRFANKLLLFSLLAQSPFLVVIVVRFFVIDLVLPSKLFWFFAALSALFAIIGFGMVCRQLALWDEALQNSSFNGLMQPRTLGGMELAGGIQLLFYGMFLIPLLNLPAILWGKARANAALRDIDAALKAPRRN